MNIEMTQKAHELLGLIAGCKALNKKPVTLYFSAVNYVDYSKQCAKGFSTCHVNRFSTSSLTTQLLDSRFTAFATDYLDTYASQWADSHGSFGSFTFDTMVKTIRLELSLLGVVQASTTYPIGKD